MAVRKFVFIAEGDVFMQMLFDDEMSGRNAAAWAAGLNSNPTVVEVTDNQQIVPGWSWDGVNFTPPQE